MEYNQIRCFCKVAELEHLSRAAIELGISQPNLSKTIRMLENELKCKLFDRDGRGIRLNESGKVFWKHAKKSLRELEEGKFLLSQNAQEQTEIVMSLISGYQILPVFFQTMRERMPNLKVKIVREDLRHASPTWDLMIYSSSCMPVEENEILLYKEELFLLVSEKHPLAKYDTVNLQAVAEEPMFGDSNAGSIGDVVDDCCRQAGFAPNMIITTDNGSLTQKLVALNVGVAIMIGGAQFYPGTKLLTINQPVCYRYLILRWRNYSKTVEEMIGIMTGVCERADFLAG